MDGFADIQLRLCLLEKECLGGHSGNNPPWPHPKGHRCRGCETGLHKPHDECPQCNGTGKVPLLEGVREKCPEFHKWQDGEEGWTEGKNCPTCQGRGWFPTQDPWKWLEALTRPEVLSKRQQIDLGISTLGGELVFFCALEKALISQLGKGKGGEMLKVKFGVEFGRQGKIEALGRVCDMPIPNCTKCNFRAWCDALRAG